MTKRQNFQLRKLQEKDLETILEWRNSGRVRANMYSDHIISWEEHKTWFNKMQAKEDVSYHICELSQRPIGVISFTDIDWQNQMSFWGFYVGEFNFPLPLGVYVEFLALEYAFETLKFKQLKCEVFNFNQAAIKLHKKFGFRQEEILIDYAFKNDQYLDVIRFSLFQEDWIKNKDKIARLAFR
jgi:UDP-4-amino-4,6-dideoxy-N-acetyl-beta-L-altrosamine N-acetyltransferase